MVDRGFGGRDLVGAEECEVDMSGRPPSTSTDSDLDRSWGLESDDQDGSILKKQVLAAWRNCKPSVGAEDRALQALGIK